VNFHPNGFLLSTDVYGCQSLPDFVESNENDLLMMINLVVLGESFHAQHRDIYSAKQRAGQPVTTNVNVEV